METMALYIGIVTGLFLLYVAFRLLYMDFVKLSSMPQERDYFPGKGIEAKPLSETVQHIRDELKAPHKVPRSSLKRALMVEKKRAEIAKLPFFHHDPEPDPDPHEHDEPGMHISLI